MLGQFTASKTKGIVPANTPEQTFELYSVPAFEARQPEIVTGAQIGSNKQIVEPGTVILCKINPRINRAWVVGSFSEHPKIASTEWITFPPHEDIEPKYLAHFLSQDLIRRFLASQASGVGGSLMRVKPSVIRDFPLPLPPLDEQRRIVAELETQLTRLDASVTALKRVQANLKRYRASVLKAAYEGYASVKLGTVLTFRNGVNFKANQRGESGVKVVDVKNMYGLSIMLDTKDIYTVALDGFDRFLLEANDVLFVRSSVKREGVGWPVLVGELAEPVTFCGFLIRGRPVSKQIDPRFLVYALRTPRIRGAIVNLGSEVTITNISQDDLAALDIPLPIKDEQHRIVAEVEHRLSVIEELEATVAANLKRAERLRQSVLGRAFS